METTKTHGAAAGEAAADTGPAADTEPDRTGDGGATDATTPGTVPAAAGEEPLDLDESDESDDPDEPEPVEAPHAATPAGVVPGAAAVVGAALGLASLTGTWLGTVLAERRQLTGQINTSSGTAAQQIEQIYGAPWHTTAAVNGICALTALVVLAAVLLAGRNAAPWVRAVAWGGLALGALGLFVAAGTWFDLFGGLPSVAEAPVSSGG